MARFIRTYDMKARSGELPALTQKGYAALDIMESHLQSAQWFVGSGPTIADIALYGYTHVAAEGGFELSDYPHTRAWLSRVSEHPRHILITDIPH